MTDRTGLRLATTSARLLAGTLASAGAVALVVTAVSLPWPTLTGTPAVVDAVPGAATSTVACAGDLLALGRDLEDPGSISTAAGQSVTAGVAAGAPEPTDTRLVAQGTDGEGPAVFTAEPQDGERTDLAAAGSSAVYDEDLAGFAASACHPPLIESWLVGGAGTTGAADLVLLANPGTVAATVQLTVYGASGAQTPPGGVDIVVPAGSQRVVPLAGLALGEQSPVVRVTASGAPVQASLQTSITRTLVAGGVDQVAAVAAPETHQVIGGIAVTAPPGAEGESDVATIARILSPGVTADATVTIRAVGSAEPIGDPRTVPLGAGVPTEIDFRGLAVGQYVLDIESETPIVSAAWQTTGFGSGADFAWYTPSPVVEMASLFAVPSGAAATLTIVNPGAEPVPVTVTRADGTPVTQATVGAGASAALEVPRDAVYLLDSGGAPVRAAISQTGDSALGGFPVWPADAASPAVTVYP